MPSGEKTLRVSDNVIASLSELAEYYQSLYESYLNEAMRAKAQLEKTQELLNDLYSRQTIIEALPNQAVSYPPQRLETEQTSKKIEVSSTPASFSTSPATENLLSIQQQRSISIKVKLQEIFTNESEVALHQNYLLKAVSENIGESITEEELKECLWELSQENTCYQDKFDKNCYWSSNKKGVGQLQLIPDTLPPKEQKNTKSSLREIILEFFTIHQGQITNQDIIKYIYPESERNSWDTKKRDDISKNISAILCNKRYLDRWWHKVDRGIYRSLIGQNNVKN